MSELSIRIGIHTTADTSGVESAAKSIDNISDVAKKAEQKLESPLTRGARIETSTRLWTFRDSLVAPHTRGVVEGVSPWIYIFRNVRWQVTLGTRVSPPPHRSWRAALPHRVLALSEEPPVGMAVANRRHGLAAPRGFMSTVSGERRALTRRAYEDDDS